MGRTAGYREIPQHLIDEAARRVGLRSEEVPPICIRNRLAFCQYRPPCYGGPLVEIRRREHRSKIPYTLRHEFAHHKLNHHIPPDRLDCDREEWVRYEAKHDLEADILTEGRADLGLLQDIVGYMHGYHGFTKRKATSIVRQEARKLGVSKRTLRALGGNGRKEE